MMKKKLIVSMTSSVDVSCRLDQMDEMTAIEAIIDNTQFTYNKQDCSEKADCLISGQLSVKAKVADKVKVRYKCQTKQAKGEQTDSGVYANVEDSFHLRHLPPIDLQFVLPSDYPEKSPPQIQVKCSWMTDKQIDEIVSKLHSMWSEGTVILYLWFDFLQEDTCQFLQINDEIDISIFVQQSIDKRNKEIQDRLDKAIVNLRSVSEVSKLTENASVDDISVKQIEDDIEALEIRIMFSKLKEDQVNNVGEDVNRNLSCDEVPIKEKVFRKKNKDTKLKDFQISSPWVLKELRPVAEMTHNKENRELNSKAEEIIHCLRKSKDRLEGYVLKWKEERSHGFLKRKEEEMDEVFFHLSNVIVGIPPEKGHRVTYTLARGKKGRPEAQDVIILPPKKKLSINPEPRSDPKELANKKEELLAGANLITKLPKCEEETIRKMERKLWTEKFVPPLVRMLQDYEALEEQNEFKEGLFNCKVCFQERLGADCIKFNGCGHVYCSDCMKEHFRVQIEDGAVNNLTCPEEKCESQANPDQVKLLLPKALYERYESHLLQTTLDSMGDIIVCPRIHCQNPVLIDRENSFGNCANPNCAFVFCIYCKATYHGVQPCKIKSKEQEALIKSYMKAEGEQKRLLEKRYGKKQLNIMTNEYLSESYKESNSKRCPNCSAPIQKSDGCNKMTCNKCNCHFCYLCGVRLNKDNPYSHFNDRNGDCYTRLFEGVVDDDWENEFDLDQEEDFVVFHFL